MASSTSNASLGLLYWSVCIVILSVTAKYASSEQEIPTVIIIGAGMSGIMAAKTLSMHGIEDFLILEATDRVGGRLHQEKFAGYTVELGANWVEGVGGEHVNPIWELAQKHGLRTFYSDYSNVSFNIYGQEGKLLPQSVVGPRFDLATASYNFTLALSTSMQAHGEEDISILTAQRIFGSVPASPIDMAIDFFNFDYETAEPPRVTSLKNVEPYPTFVEYGEDVHFVADPRGYVHILHELANEFLQNENGTITDVRVKLQKVVTNVKYSRHGVKVTTEDNFVYYAKYAIMSVSLGVLKSQLITYTPDLPYWKIKTFYQFDLAIFTKIFLKFPYSFWPTGPGTEFFMYADDKRGYYPLWQHLERELPGSHILFVAVSDDESRRIEQQPDEVTKAEAMAVLRKIFGQGIPEAEQILIPRWWKNRLFGGSYTNWPIGVSEADFDRMKAPIGPLYFTGEHTSAKFNGYVHGAYLAGIATANTVLDCINHGKCGEITSDDLPWEQRNATEKGNHQFNKTSCTGSCCVEVQKEREKVRQPYVEALSALEDALARKCKGKHA